MTYHFFTSSRNAVKQVTELFDFFWPTVSSLWNLRLQVEGFRSIKPNVTEKELHHKFNTGSGIRGVSFKRSFIEQSWDNQQEAFAKILLTNLFAIHESWLEELSKDLGFSNNHIKGMQFPTDLANNRGIWTSINSICSNESVMLKNTYYNILLNQKKNSKSNLDNLMMCYRYFKELRNCLIHNGGKANQNLLDAYNNFNNVASVGLLGVAEVPLHEPIDNDSIGNQIKLHLRGVVSFGEIILRIIATCDCELSKSKLAEPLFDNMWKNVVGKKTLKSDPIKRDWQIKRYSNKLGLPIPNEITSDIQSYITSKNLAFL